MKDIYESDSTVVYSALAWSQFDPCLVEETSIGGRNDDGKKLLSITNRLLTSGCEICHIININRTYILNSCHTYLNNMKLGLP